MLASESSQRGDSGGPRGVSPAAHSPRLLPRRSWVATGDVALPCTGARRGLPSFAASLSPPPPPLRRRSEGAPSDSLAEARHGDDGRGVMPANREPATRKELIDQLSSTRRRHMPGAPAVGPSISRVQIGAAEPSRPAGMEQPIRGRGNERLLPPDGEARSTQAQLYSAATVVQPAASGIRRAELSEGSTSGAHARCCTTGAASEGRGGNHGRGLGGRAAGAAASGSGDGSTEDDGGRGHIDIATRRKLCADGTRKRDALGRETARGVRVHAAAMHGGGQWQQG